MGKHFFKPFIILLGSLVLAGCGKDAEEKAELRLDDINFNFSKSSYEKLLEIPELDESSNYWHVYSPSGDTWLSYERLPGRKAMYVKADGNTTGEIRSSYIMIRSQHKTLRINVSQDCDVRIDVSQNYLGVRYLNSSSTISILNTEELDEVTATVESAAQDWLSVLLEGDVLHVNIKINPLETPREALITVSGKRKVSGETTSAFISVYQARGGMTPYVFDIPDFSESQVYKVMDGQKQVAQITREYLRGVGKVNAQAVVVYPVENDEVNLGLGYVAQILLENSDLSDATNTFKVPAGAVHGGSVSFDAATNTLSGYVAGRLADPVTRIYMPGDVGMGPEELPECTQATVAAHVIEDVRNTETNIYPIVKIGTQYWMAKNLNTVYYNADKSYAPIPTGVTSAMSRATDYCCIFGHDNAASTDEAALTNRTRYGLLYSYLAIGGFSDIAASGLPAEQTAISGETTLIADHISPSGWLVPDYADLTSLIAYIKHFTRLRNFIDYSTGEQIVFMGGEDDNITGFDAPMSSYRVTGGGYQGVNNTTSNGFRMCCTTFKGFVSGNFVSRSMTTTGYSASEPITRAFSIRSMNNGAIKIKQAE